MADADRLKNVLSVLNAALPWLEKQVRFLPVNPAVREDVMWVSAVAAGVAGLGGYQSAKRSGQWIGWVGLAFFLGCLALMLSITSAGMTLGLTPAWISVLVRLAYVGIFFFLGLAVGSFIALL